MIGNSQGKKEIVKTIVAAAKPYHDKLVGRRFLYYFEGQHIEVEYQSKNFLHLTGVNTLSE